MDYASCLEVLGLWEGDFMKNKIYIAKSLIWFFLWLYTLSIQRDVVIIFKIAKNFEIICFLLFITTMNFISIYSCLKNINEYLLERIIKEDEND